MKRIVPFLIIFLFGLLAILDLAHPGFAVTHDGQDHIARIANFYSNLQQGVLIPRWAANLNWGYGHPILEFLYPLPSYMASLFHFLGFSFIDSTKLIFALAMVASGITMYFFIAAMWGEIPGIVSGVLYMYAPYRFVDLYVRGDIGEHVAFVFVPLVFLTILLLSKKQTFGRLFLASLSLAFLILAHNAIALMFAPIIFIYLVFLLYREKWSKKLLYNFLLFFILGFLLSSFFWVPALFEGQYTLRNIVTKGEYISRFITFTQLIYGPWNYGQTGMFTVQLGILPWVFSVWSFLVIIFRKDKFSRLFIGGTLFITVISIFLMLPVSNVVWSRIILLQNFQFPWRFLAIPVFTTAILGGFCISLLSNRWKMYCVIIFCLLVLIVSKDYVHAKSYEQKPEGFFSGVYKSTTDTGESSPIWSVRFMGKQFDKPVDVIQGNAKVIEQKRLVTKHEYIVKSVGKSRLVENTLYFPGWSVMVDGKNVPVQFQDPQYRGLMTFFVGNGQHSVIVSYHESKYRLLGDFLSIAGLSIICFLLIFARIKKHI